MCDLLLISLQTIVAILLCAPSGLAKDQRVILLDRSRMLLAYLKQVLFLANLAQGQKRIPRLLHRRATDYRRLGLTGRCLKLNADKEKWRTLSTIQQLLGRLAVLNLDQVIPTVTEVDCESRVVGTT
jgi:hypothetical protein